MRWRWSQCTTERRGTRWSNIKNATKSLLSTQPHSWRPYKLGSYITVAMRTHQSQCAALRSKHQTFLLFSVTVLANSRADIQRHALISLCTRASKSQRGSFSELQLVGQAQRPAAVLSILPSSVQVSSQLVTDNYSSSYMTQNKSLEKAVMSVIVYFKLLLGGTYICNMCRRG